MSVLSPSLSLCYSRPFPFNCISLRSVFIVPVVSSIFLSSPSSFSLLVVAFVFPTFINMPTNSGNLPSNANEGDNQSASVTPGTPSSIALHLLHVTWFTVTDRNAKRPRIFPPSTSFVSSITDGKRLISSTAFSSYSPRAPILVSRSLPLFSFRILAGRHAIICTKHTFFCRWGADVPDACNPVTIRQLCPVDRSCVVSVYGRGSSRRTRPWDAVGRHF